MSGRKSWNFHIVYSQLGCPGLYNFLQLLYIYLWHHIQTILQHWGRWTRSSRTFSVRESSQGRSCCLLSRYCWPFAWTELWLALHRFSSDRLTICLGKPKTERHSLKLYCKFEKLLTDFTCRAFFFFFFWKRCNSLKNVKILWTLFCWTKSYFT